MEDSKKMKAPAGTAPGKSRVVDLTAAMAIGPARKARIIDLTQVIKSAPEKTTLPAETASPQEILKAAVQPAPIADAAPAGTVEESIEAVYAAEQPSAAALPFAGEDRLPTQPAELEGPRPAVAESELELTIDELALDLPEEQLSQTSLATDLELPTAPPQMLKSSSGEATIELNEVVSPQEAAGDSGRMATAPFFPAAARKTGEDTIELTDIVPAAEAARGDDESADPIHPAEPKPGEDTIELTDVVPTAAAAGEEEALKGEEAAGDEEIIELTDVVQRGNGTSELIDEAEITLTLDKVMTGGNGAVAQSGREEEMIELTDIVGADEAAQGGEEEIIELTQVVEPQGDLLEPEEVIELTDSVDANEAAQDRGEEIIELTEIVEFQGNLLEPEEVITPARVEAVTASDQDQLFRGLEEAFAKVAGDRGERAVPEERPAGPAALSLGENEIEKAIEKILRTQYGHTIEALIAGVVEKVVTREMENIKRNLLEDGE